jgi:DNA-binding transcriptional ArsR family regulator
MNLQPISSLLRAISQPARLEILLAIGSGEACVCHLEAATGQRQAYISQQLMALRAARIVTSRRDGRNIYYRLLEPSVLDLIQQAGVISSPKELNIPIQGPESLFGECPCPKCDGELSDNPEMLTRNDLESEVSLRGNP